MSLAFKVSLADECGETGIVVQGLQIGVVAHYQSFAREQAVVDGLAQKGKSFVRVSMFGFEGSEVIGGFCGFRTVRAKNAVLEIEQLN